MTPANVKPPSAEVARCDREIALCLCDLDSDICALIGLRDWTWERRLILEER